MIPKPIKAVLLCLTCGMLLGALSSRSSREPRAVPALPMCAGGPAAPSPGCSAGQCAITAFAQRCSAPRESERLAVHCAAELCTWTHIDWECNC